jgi:hypothetical protein
MPGENGGELAGFLGEMMMGRLEKMAAGRAAQYAGREVFGQVTPQQMQEMPEYFKNGAPYGPTKEGMMRWISEQSATATAAAAERLAGVASPPVQAPLPAQNTVAQGKRIRSFAEGEHIRSFAEGEQIRGFGE